MTRAISPLPGTDDAARLAHLITAHARLGKQAMPILVHPLFARKLQGRIRVTGALLARIDGVVGLYLTAEADA